MLHIFFKLSMLAYNKDMGSYEENYLNKRPQSLCHMCGRCCRISTTPKSYKELLRLKSEGDQGAIDFLNIFVPYPSIDAAREADKALVDNILDKLKEGGFSTEDITFYRCKYILDNNMCSIYEERPTLCIHCPSTPWVIVPPGCGFEGWLFLMRERDKKRIRKAKEDLLELKLLKTKMKNPDDFKKIEAVENKIYNTIEKFKKYGSENW